MPTLATDEELLQRLPQPIAEQMRQALQALDAGGAPKPVMPVDAYPGMKVTCSPTETDADEILDAVFEQVKFPEGPIVSPDNLDPTCRTLVELLANRPVNPGVAMPRTPWARRRWLGIDPPTAAERPVSFELGGKKHSVPLYQALGMIEAEEECENSEEIIDGIFAGMSPLERLDAYAGLAFGCYHTDAMPGIELDGITASFGSWSARMAPRFAAYAAPDATADRNGNSEIPDDLRRAILLGLIRAKLPIDPRCDVLLVLGWGVYEKVTSEMVASIPEPRRGVALARALDEELPHARLRLATDLLGRYPSRPVLEVYIDAINSNWTDLHQKPRRERFGKLINFLENAPELREIVLEHAARLPALPELTIGRAFRVRSVEQLSPSMRKQFNVLGRGWENDSGMMVDGPADAPEYGQISGVVAYEILDHTGNLAYEAFLYNDEDGAVCRAGTTNSVAYCSQRTLRCNAGDDLLEALALVLSTELPAEQEEEEPQQGEAKEDGAWAAYRMLMAEHRKAEENAPAAPSASPPAADPEILPGEKLARLSDYVRVMKGVMKGDMVGTLEREGLDMATYARLAGLWGQKMASDPALAARYGQLIAG
jgi:hypothetical protein